MTEIKNIKLLTPKFRVSFPQLFEAVAYNPGDKPKFSVVALFDKKTDISELKKLANAAIKAKWGSKVPKNLRSPFRDGEEKDYEGYENVTFCTFSSIKKPGVVDACVNTIIDPEDVYPGCYGRATVGVYTYGGVDRQTPGVAFGLRNFQKIEEGEPLGGGFSKPEDDFDAVETADSKDPLFNDDEPF